MIFKNAKHQVNRKAKIILIIFGSIVFFFVGVFFQRFGLYGEKIAPYFAQMKRELKTNSTNNKLENISIDIPFINYNTIEEKRLEALRISKLIVQKLFGTLRGKSIGILGFVLLALSCYVFAVWIVNGELSPYSGDEGRSLKLILQLSAISVRIG